MTLYPLREIILKNKHYKNPDLNRFTDLKPMYKIKSEDTNQEKTLLTGLIDIEILREFPVGVVDTFKEFYHKVFIQD